MLLPTTLTGLLAPSVLFDLKSWVFACRLKKSWFHFDGQHLSCFPVGYQEGNISASRDWTKLQTQGCVGIPVESQTWNCDFLKGPIDLWKLWKELQPFHVLECEDMESTRIILFYFRFATKGWQKESKCHRHLTFATKNPQVLWPFFPQQLHSSQENKLQRKTATQGVNPSGGWRADPPHRGNARANPQH